MTMDEAAERAHGFWRWYLRQGWERPLRASFYLFLYVVFLGILAYAAIRDYRGREFWLFFIRNPFFYLMWVTLISSYIDLGYMRYRLQQSGYPSEFLGDGIM